MISKFNLGHHVTHPIGILLEGARYRTLNTFAVWQDDAYAKVGEIFPKRSQGRSHVRIARNHDNLLSAFIWR